jgi:hypothetical protein
MSKKYLIYVDILISTFTYMPLLYIEKMMDSKKNYPKMLIMRIVPL